MSVDVDYFPRIRMKDTILATSYDRRNSWAPSLSSSSSSAATTTTTATTSWVERKIFSHFKRLFQRKSSLPTSISPLSSRRASSPIAELASLSANEQPLEEIEVEQLTNSVHTEDLSPIAIVQSVELLYDYDRLLARCLERRDQDRTKMMQRCQTPISIPHADLSLHSSRSILVNWKTYVRLFRGLTRHPKLFQQYLNEYYHCQSLINQREQMVLPIRTNQATFDNILRKFLDGYVTCLTCQTAQTHLIQFDGKCLIECQLCGSQRMVKRLRWKRH